MRTRKFVVSQPWLSINSFKKHVVDYLTQRCSCLINKDSITTSASSHVWKIVRPCIFICLFIYIILHFKSKLVCDVPSLNLTQLNVWYAKYPLTIQGITFGWPSSEIDLDWLYVLLRGLNDLFVGRGYSNTEKTDMQRNLFVTCCHATWAKCHLPGITKCVLFWAFG